jgi:hypothetical protein
MKAFFQLFTGFYLYIETSTPRQFGDKATILTPNLNGSQCMTFSYHMNGRDIGVLNIYASDQTIFSKSGNQGNQWVGVKTSILQRGSYMVSKESNISNGRTKDHCFFETRGKLEDPEETSIRILLFLHLDLYTHNIFVPNPKS